MNRLPIHPAAMPRLMPPGIYSWNKAAITTISLPLSFIPKANDSGTNPDPTGMRLKG